MGNANDGSCAGNAAVNPDDGLVYLAYSDPGSTSIATVDPKTGVFSLIARTFGAYSMPGFTITKDGNAFFFSGPQLNSLDLSTASATAVGTGLGVSPDVMGYNRIDDKVYAFSWDSGTSTFLAYAVNTSTGVATADSAHNITMANYSYNGNTGYNLNSVESMTFDGNGNPWFVGDNFQAELMVADFATGSATFVGEITNATIRTSAPHAFHTQSIFIVAATPRSSALPDTGSRAIALVSTGTIAAGLLAAGAIALIIVRRRKTTT